LHNTILPMYNPEATESDDRDDNITKIRDVLSWTDALVLGSPDYHGSRSGILKTFFRLLLERICWKNLSLSLLVS
ncbi:MAG TPA: NAD(P)H-dependent oxidoreductase, partial [Nitrososphaeraceae archaeon]|nr:NAD(P)H-dependent oxidoreductase [Nitrososphaeraceae archaeon]